MLRVLGGHTPGTLGIDFTVYDAGKPYRAFIFGGAAPAGYVALVRLRRHRFDLEAGEMRRDEEGFVARVQLVDDVGALLGLVAFQNG